MELLTSDMMIIELGVFKRRIPWWGIPYNWVVVCECEAYHFQKLWLTLNYPAVLGNLAGSLFFAAILVKYTGLVTAPINTFITNAANSRGSLPWHEVFLRGIGCNIMVSRPAAGMEAFSSVFSVIGLPVCLRCYSSRRCDQQDRGHLHDALCFRGHAI